MELESDVEEETLIHLLKGPLSKYEIAEASGRAYSAVHKAVSNLLRKGLISIQRVAAGAKNPKMQVEYYELTEPGREMAERLAARKEVEVESTLPKASTLIDWYTNRFTRFLYHLDLTTFKITPAQALVTLNIYPFVLFVRALISPDTKGRIYNRFMASVFIQSVDKRFVCFDEEQIKRGLRPFYVELMWRACSPHAWRMEKGEEPIPGYQFNFLEAYKANLNQDIASILKDSSPNISDEELPGLVFARLKLRSHPIQERGKLIKDIWAKS